MAEGRGNLWVALAAIGTLLGGTAAIVAVVRETREPATTPPPALVATYSESLNCWVQSEHIQRSAGSHLLDGAIDLVIMIDQISERAEASAMHLASTEDKTPADVRSDYLIAGGPNFDTVEPAVLDLASFRREAERVTRLCSRFHPGE